MPATISPLVTHTFQDGKKLLKVQFLGIADNVELFVKVEGIKTILGGAEIAG